VEIGSANKCFLSSRETRSSFKLSDMIMARIKSVDETGTIDLTDARLLKDGQIARISPVKVPRLIGKKNSMIGLIAAATGCMMYVGRNGTVFISNEGDVSLAREAILMIEKEAHIPGLTDRMAEFLSSRTGKELSAQSGENYDGMPRSQEPPQRGGDRFSRGGPRRPQGRFSRERRR
jgi:exosome complex component RRP4